MTGLGNACTFRHRSRGGTRLRIRRRLGDGIAIRGRVSVFLRLGFWGVARGCGSAVLPTGSLATLLRRGSITRSRRSTILPGGSLLLRHRSVTRPRRGTVPVAGSLATLLRRGSVTGPHGGTVPAAGSLATLLRRGSVTGPRGRTKLRSRSLHTLLGCRSTVLAPRSLATLLRRGSVTGPRGGTKLRSRSLTALLRQRSTVLRTLLRCRSTVVRAGSGLTLLLVRRYEALLGHGVRVVVTHSSSSFLMCLREAGHGIRHILLLFSD